MKPKIDVGKAASQVNDFKAEGNAVGEGQRGSIDRGRRLKDDPDGFQREIRVEKSKSKTSK